ncbi:AAA family ATPase [Flavobacterium aquicola]|uniref:Putative ATP-dependent endonuclease of OLD family n=1 Tax=Flavobacterium aquicola TaxID=1682742 RepID=A0A3E0EVF2_9FLAO|nr:AAA family ATPase [Flavobacterium aquicola]REH01681.1 putative ATP-dependent endonuclease of OLD family [Flavobacterium aquicola]
MKDSFDLIIEDTKRFKDYFLGEEEQNISFLPSFNSINIVVGTNNSGKSRFIRNLMEFDKFNAVDDLLKIREFVPIYNMEVEETNVKIYDAISRFQQRVNNTYYSESEYYRENVKVLVANKLINLEMTSLDSFLTIVNRNISNLQNIKHLGVENDYLSNFNKIDKNFYKEYENFKSYYIPTLRSAHSLFNFDSDLNKYSKIEDDVYLYTYLKNYKINNKVEIFTGLHLYREILNARNSKRETRNKFEKFQDFVGENFFDGKKIDIVAEFKKEYNLDGKNDNEIISVDIEGEIKSRDLCDLGDGIQALIILMYKIFMAEDNSFMYIDEPELNLHPGMQRLFLEQITNNKDLKKKNITYVITTHSNHFLDLTIEKDNISIYSFSIRNNDLGDNQFTIRNVNRGDNSLLKELGVNNSSVFMANCSIWVEGISDRNYIKAFLKSYCDSIGKSYPKEDIDFAFFEYAGSNIDHYIFEDEIEDEKKEFVINDIKALSLSNKIFLLADSDAVTKTKNKQKFERLEALQNAESDNFKPKIIWNIREIENLLTNEMWKEILIEFCNKTLVKSNEAEVLLKIEEALSDVKYSDYEKKYVGEFLEVIRTKMGKSSSSFILNQSAYEVKSDGSFGTIINKRELSELVFNKNFSWDILSKNKEIEKLTKDIYDFITQK